MDPTRRRFLRFAGTFPLAGFAGMNPRAVKGAEGKSSGEAPDVFPESAAGLSADSPIFVGEERQLFLDDFLIARRKNVRIRVHEPTRQPEKLVWDRPWEGSSSTYGSVLYDPETKIYRMFYIGSQSSDTPAEERHPCMICSMESRDGIHWTRPNFGVEFNGIQETNILFTDMQDFNPFIDLNPNAKPEERYK